MDHLTAREQESIFVIREAYNKISPLGMLWSIGKDSTVMLWLTMKAFFGKVPFPLVHIDTSYKIPSMIEYRDKVIEEWGLDLIVGQNEEALADGMNYKRGRMTCCHALKTKPLEQVIEKHDFKGIFLGIRGDEEGSRGKERFFSPRNRKSEWDIKNQPPEFWDQFRTEFPDDEHIRIHPLLHWTELEIWQYIHRENIPVIDLYFAEDGERYRSLGCAPCTGKFKSEATTVEEIIEELTETRLSERAGRAQDKADAHAMQKLRSKGYM